MGRCEAFATSNRPGLSFLDGLGSGIGYSFVLLFIAFFREIMGQGSFFGVALVDESWTRWIIMVLPSGAFFMLGAAIWLARYISPSQPTGGTQ
jgi:Na+-transporting NADH:ubiquinone oxidoreductase subunit D